MTNKGATPFERKTKDAEIATLEFKTGKHDYGRLLKSMKGDKYWYTKNITKINGKKCYTLVLKILVGVSGLTVGTSLSITGVRTSFGVPIAGFCSFLASLAKLVTNECNSQLKVRYTKLKNWTKLITILHDKTLEKPRID